MSFISLKLARPKLLAGFQAKLHKAEQKVHPMEMSEHDTEEGLQAQQSTATRRVKKFAWVLGHTASEKQIRMQMSENRRSALEEPRMDITELLELD